MDAEDWHTITCNQEELLQVMAIDGLLVIRQRLDASDNWQVLALDARDVWALCALLVNFVISDTAPHADELSSDKTSQTTPQHGVPWKYGTSDTPS